MDSLEGSRAQNLDAVDIAIKYGQKIQQEVDKNQVDLFGTGESQNKLIKTPTLGNSEEWSEQEALSKEMEVLGLYVSGHPLLEHADDLEEFTTVSFEEGQEISKKDTVLVGGMITKIVRRYDKRNREMAFFDLDCLGGHAEIVVFSDCYKSYGNLIDDGKVVFVRGKPSETSDFSDLKILSDEIISVENVRDRLSQCLNIKFAIGKVETSDIDDLMAISKSNPGGCKLLFHLPNPDSPKPLKVLAHNISVSTNITFIKQLRDKYGKDNVWID
jgi:DNA polymerase-3 subunit alpha